MAEEPGQAKSIHQLRQEIAHSRDRVARDLEGLRYELDFPLKFRKSFQRKTAAWVGAAVVMGVVSAVMPARTKKIRIRANPKSEPRGEILGAGLALGALRLAATLLRPAVTRFVARKMSNYATGNRRL